jgi:RHS repeat-associated protein
VLSASWTAQTDQYKWSYTWQGGRLDLNTGYLFFDSTGEGRDYSTSLGRWLEVDRLGLRPDVNDYRLEGNGVVGRLDASGKQPAAGDNAALNRLGQELQRLNSGNMTGLDWRNVGAPRYKKGKQGLFLEVEYQYRKQPYLITSNTA